MTPISLLPRFHVITIQRKEKKKIIASIQPSTTHHQHQQTQLPIVLLDIKQIKSKNHQRHFDDVHMTIAPHYSQRRTSGHSDSKETLYSNVYSIETKREGNYCKFLRKENHAPISLRRDDTLRMSLSLSLSLSIKQSASFTRLRLSSQQLPHPSHQQLWSIFRRHKKLNTCQVG